VKPDGCFDELGLANQMARGIEFSEAFGDVLLIVIVPVRFGIGGTQAFIPRKRIALRVQRMPKLFPSFWTWPTHKGLFRN